MDIIKYRENKKISILLVEDEEILCKIYEKVISREGYKVLVSKNGKSGLNKYREHDIDLVILDLMLPDMSGVDVLKQIRKDKRQVKVIVLTNMLNINVMQQIVDFGVNAYLSKSDYTPAQILFTIESVISSNKTLAITNS